MDTLSVSVALIFLEKTKSGVNTVRFSNALKIFQAKTYSIFQDGSNML